LKEKDTVTIAWDPWAAPKDKRGAAASGDVVWNAAEEKGYMRISGLPPNDPDKERYQLWVFDEAGDQR
jgi:hypothetical protein